MTGDSRTWLVGAFGGAAIGGALLPGWWGLLPAILGAGVGLAASRR